MFISLIFEQLFNGAGACKLTNSGGFCSLFKKEKNKFIIWLRLKLRISMLIFYSGS